MTAGTIWQSHFYNVCKEFTESEPELLYERRIDMAKWVCNVCGYVFEGENPPEKCPVCKAPASKFTKQADELVWAAV